MFFKILVWGFGLSNFVLFNLKFVYRRNFVVPMESTSPTKTKKREWTDFVKEDHDVKRKVASTYTFIGRNTDIAF